MTRRRAGIVLAALALLPLTAAFTRGGWWVHTVENLPEYLVAGKPVELSISLRQHGITPMPGASMQVHLTGPDSVTVLNATPSARPGYYTANLLVSEPGEWTIALQSGYMRLELLPVRAIASGSPPPARLPAEERGRQLYIAKGCITCHGSQTSLAPGAGSLPAVLQVNAAPELIGRSFPSRAYVEQVMTDPGGRLMPNLNLSREEIEAIATFLHPES